MPSVRARLRQSRDGGHRTVRQHPALQSAKDARRQRRRAGRRCRAAAEPDAEVSFVQRDLASLLPRAKIAGTDPDGRGARSACAKAANWKAPRQRQNPTRRRHRPGRAARLRAREGNPDPYAGFEARIVPENITLLPKTATRPGQRRERTHARSSRRATISRASCASSAPLPEEIRAIASALGFARPRQRPEGRPARCAS